MDQRERDSDPLEVLLAALDGRQTRLWTALPGIVQSFNAAEMTAEVQPAIKGRTTDRDNNVQFVDLPLLVDCPVFFPAGGGATLTFPIAAGDEVLVVFASRCIDGWWESGGVQAPLEARMHDLSDGFVLAGFRSKARALSPAPDTAKVQLRSDDGETVVELDPDGQTIRLTAPAGVTVDADLTVNGDTIANGNMTINGDLAVNGDLLATGQVDLGGLGGSLVKTVLGTATKVRAV